MAEFIEFLSPSALADLKKGNDELLLMIKNVDVIGQKMSKINNPSGSDSAIKDLNAKLLQQEASYARLQIQLEKYTQAQNRTKISNNQVEKSNISLEASIERKNKAIEREQAKLTASQNIYNKVQQKLNALSNEYKALAVQKELTGKLTDKESQRYDFLAGKITKYDTTLKAVDASMGKYQRNVGNYASAFNPLGNSINQLTREMPAFANSVQTGFMAISNNLPIFFDSMQQIINQNKELQAQGQPTQSVFKQLATSIFSLQTGLSIGVTLLTLYGAQIWESISGAKERKKALEEETKAIELKAKAEDEARTKLAQYQSEEISRAKILLENAKNIELPYKKRLESIKELQTRYPDYLGQLSKEELLAGNTAIAEQKLNDALVKRGIALASQQAIQDEINNSLKNQKWLNDKLNEIQTKRLALGKEISQIDPFTKNENLLKKYDELSLQLTRLFYLEGTLKEQYSDKNKVIQNSLKYYLDQYNANSKYIDVVKEDTKAQNDNKKAKEENFKFGTEEWLKQQISNLEELRSKTETTAEGYKEIGGGIAFYNEWLQTLLGTQKKTTKAQEEVAEGLELTEEQIYADYYAWLKLKDATNEYIKTLSSNAFNKAFNDIGLNSAKMFLDFDENGQSTFDKLIEGADKLSEKFAITFQTVGDLAQDVFNKMVNLSNERFDIERANLEKSKQIALLFAGDTASAVQNIEEQYQEKQRAIKNREAQAKKKQAVFNILIDTAQGVVSALASTPPNVPLSIAIGVIGALQAGIVNSQEVPQFFKGTDNAPEGLAFTQEKGREIITDKSGKIKSYGSDKGAQLTYLNKGDKVFTAEKSSMMFNENLNNLLVNNGIDMPKIQINNQAITDAQINRIVDTIANKETANLNIDKSGLNFYVSNGYSIKQRTNNRVTFKGQSV